ncbi:DUF7005 family protein [Chryseobacterium mucoviscidosis]|uniref:DUF7005 family protein n=1 Tax=Chryseobacterium mucoviscidosis TaxID=1945581 RepID=UPI0031D89441
MNSINIDLPKVQEKLHISSELDTYFQNKFSSDKLKTIQTEEKEPYMEFWESYLQTKNIRTFQVLKNFYPQLYFPIQKGIDKTENYIDAILKGQDSYKSLQEQIQVIDEDGFSITLHKYIIGAIPVLSVKHDNDFVTIVQSLLHKNNPVVIPQSMGAFLANGINNWARIHSLKEKWIKDNPFGNWNNEFSRNILPNPDLYKDKIIVLSSKPYSNISSERLNLSEEQWKSYSYSIRLEHEYTHLYTLKRYGYASNNLHDELIADYIGISKTLGSYNKEWMLLFIGLEDYPKYREGARLQNYLGDVNLPEEGFKKLTEIIKDAIESISNFDKKLGGIKSDKDHICRIEALCEIDLLNIAAGSGCSMLIKKYNEKLISIF